MIFQFFGISIIWILWIVLYCILIQTSFYLTMQGLKRFKTYIFFQEKCSDKSHDKPIAALKILLPKCSTWTNQKSNREAVNLFTRFNALKWLWARFENWSHSWSGSLEIYSVVQFYAESYSIAFRLTNSSNNKSSFLLRPCIPWSNGAHVILIYCHSDVFGMFFIIHVCKHVDLMNEENHFFCSRDDNLFNCPRVRVAETFHFRSKIK